MSFPDPHRLAQELIQPVHEAGARIMAHYGKARVDYKDDRSPVTAADREADAVLVAALANIAPDIPVVSEESSPAVEIDPDAAFFLVDPLDGTKEFISTRTEFTVNVALVDARAPCFGIVYAPALSALYVTLARDEAVKIALDPARPAPGFDTLEKVALRTRAPASGGLTAAVSRSHMDDATQAFLDAHGITDTFPSGSSLKFCCLAEGHADVYPRFGRTMEWDIAAGHAVLCAAGGAVLDETGKPLSYGKTDGNYANAAFIAWGRKPQVVSSLA